MRWQKKESVKLKKISIEIIHSEEQEKKRNIGKKKEQCLRDLKHNIKYISTYITGVPEGQERKKEAEKNTQVMAENLPNFIKKPISLTD